MKKLMMAALVAGMGLMGCQKVGVGQAEAAEGAAPHYCYHVRKVGYGSLYTCNVPNVGWCALFYHPEGVSVSCP